MRKAHFRSSERGSAFILNDLQSIETTDIATAIRIETEIRKIIDDCGVDINDDASEYDFDDLEFIFDNETFSNIIQYIFRNYSITPSALKISKI